MRRHLHACRRLMAHESGLGLVAIATSAGLFLLADAGFACTSGFTVRPAEHVFNYWLLLMLGVAYAVWTVLRVRGRIGPAGEMGFVLAAFGVSTRLLIHFILYGVAPCYSEFSVVEQVADGLLAFALGLFVVLWFSRRPTPPRGRA